MTQPITYRGYEISVDKSDSGYIARILSPRDPKEPTQVYFDHALGKTPEKAIENAKLEIDRMTNAFWEPIVKEGDQLTFPEDRGKATSGMTGIVRGVDPGRPRDPSKGDLGKRWTAEVELDSGDHETIDSDWDFQKV